MNAGGYTYLLVDDGKTKTWVATTAVELKPGSKVEIPAGMQMKDFSSPTLKRKFDDIRFVSGITIDGKKQGDAIPAGHPPIGGDAAAPAAPEANAYSGKVMETMDSGGYTYVRVQGFRGSLWAATKPFPVKVGDTVSVPDGQAMPQFTSATLKRTFDEIRFVDHIENLSRPGTIKPIALDPIAPGALPAGHPPATKVASVPNKPAPAVTEKIAQPAGATSVAEIFARRKELKGKEITVKGKVTKFTASVMNRNWIHLGDGTGTAGDNDLTITTDDTVALGDIVTLRGTLAIDQDFGYGYAYTALLEKASVQK